jgi:hypothetical protein
MHMIFKEKTMIALLLIASTLQGLSQTPEKIFGKVNIA